VRCKRLTESRKSTTSVASGLPSGRTHRTMSIGLFLLHFRPAWRKYARYTTQCKQSTDPGPMSVMLVRPGVSGFGSCGSGGSNLGGSPGHCPDLGLWSRLSLSRRRAARRPDLIRRGGHLRQTLACQTILSLVHLTETPAGRALVGDDDGKGSLKRILVAGPGSLMTCADASCRVRQPAFPSAGEGRSSRGARWPARSDTKGYSAWSPAGPEQTRPPGLAARGRGHLIADMGGRRGPPRPRPGPGRGPMPMNGA